MGTPTCRRPRAGGNRWEVLSRRAGASLLEVVVAVAVVLVGALGFAQALTQAVDLGETNRETALAAAAAQRVVEELRAADLARVFALYNDDPEDDPDGEGTAPGARFEAAGLVPRLADEGLSGRILFPTADDSPGELREELLQPKLRAAYDLDLSGDVDDADHAGDYRLLPVVVRVAWRDGNEERELEVATILGGS